jgi:DNA-binding CsgD family transcriptional regulator/predicted negative regulator of RcsB-dependent stress response
LREGGAVDKYVELLERQREQAALSALIVAACQGAGRFAAVEGAAGIGKTCLLTAAQAEAKRAGMRVLAARGMELEREFAYGVVRQLFEPALASADEVERAELLAGAAGQAASLFGKSDLTAGSMVHGDASFAMVHGLFWVTANACANRPLLLCVDDLHWSDAPSLRFFVHLLPRLEGLRVLVLVGLRPTESGTDQHLLAHVMTDPLIEVLRPAPLSQAGSAQLVRTVLDVYAEEEFCVACHVATGGNPLWLRELTSVAMAEGLEPTAAGAARLIEFAPRAVRRRVALRLARLGPAAEAVCEAVAILGHGAEPARVAALAGLELTEAVEAARQLEAVDILYWRGRAHSHGVAELSGAGLGFIHPLVRAAVYDGLSEEKRLTGHTRAARLLDEVDAGAEQVAAHLLLVPPTHDPVVAAALRRAADGALASGSPESAVTYLERCLQESPAETERVEVLIQLGAAAQLVDMAKATKYLSAALAFVQEPPGRAAVAEMLGRILASWERYDEAALVYSQAAQALGEEHTDLRRRLDAGLLGVAIADPALQELAAEYVSRLRDAPFDAGLGSRMLDTTIALYDALTMTGAPAEDAVARARRGLADGVLIEHSHSSEALIFGCMVLMAADLDDVMPLFDAWMAWAHRRGSMFGVGVVKCFRGLAWSWRGFLAEAEADLRDAVRAIEATGALTAQPIARGHLANVLIEQGRLEEAAAALEWVGIPDPLPRAGYWGWFLECRARLLILQGRANDGLKAMLACGDRVTAGGRHNPALVAAWRCGAALALFTLGRREEACTLAAEELQLAHRWGAPGALGRALRVAGIVEGGEEGLKLLREAVAVLTSSPAQLEYAKALLELGAALRRAGQRIESREYLRQGVQVAHICGAAPLVERGWTELRASGARPRRTEPLGPAALTPSEWRVAELAAAGHSNRDIAQELFITINTVEVHLTRIYRKLGIKGRAGLAHALFGPSDRMQ